MSILRGEIMNGDRTSGEKMRKGLEAVGDGARLAGAPAGVGFHPVGIGRGGHNVILKLV